MRKIATIIMFLFTMILAGYFDAQTVRAEVEVPQSIYPAIGIIVAIEDVEIIENITIREVTVKTADDNEFKYFDDADLEVGNLIALLMCDEYETPDDPVDDIIIDARLNNFKENKR